MSGYLTDEQLGAAHAAYRVLYALGARIEWSTDRPWRASADTGKVHRPTRDSLTQRPMRALGWDEPVREHGYTDTEAAELLERR